MATNPIRPDWLPKHKSKPTQQTIGVGDSALGMRRQMDDSAQALEIAENGAGLGVFYWDLDEDQIGCTDKCKQHFGISPPDPVTFDRLLSAILPDDRERFEGAIRVAVETTAKFDTEFRVVWPNATVRWLMSKGQVYCDEFGNPVRLSGICMDVTDRKKAEDAWREAQEYLAEAQERAHIGIAVRVIAENKVIWSDEVYRLWGFEPGSVQPSRELLLSRIHPDDRGMMAEVFRKAQLEGKGATLTFRVVHPDGSIRVLRGQGDAILGKDGRPEKLFGTAFDITEQTQASEELSKHRRALEQREDMFRKVVEFSPQAVLLEKDQEPYEVLLINRKFEELLGYTKDDIKVAADWWEKAYPEQVERYQVRGEWNQRVKKALATGSSVEPLESLVTCKDGSKRQVEAHLANIGEFNIITLVDLTHRRKAEAALLKTEKLASAGRMAATVAHEINNPLEAITNAVFLLAGSPNLSERDSELLALAQQELRRVAHIAKQTLGFYRESGSPTRCNLTELLHEVLSLYATRIASRKIVVREKFATETYVEAVPGELRQVLANFITNAIDAMPNGGALRVSVSRHTNWSEAAQEAAHVTIADTGTGIAPADLPRVFEPFFTTKLDFGTGLGLWVSRGIIEKHRGSIRIRSRQGEGTVVSAMLPAI